MYPIDMFSALLGVTSMPESESGNRVLESDYHGLYITTSPRGVGIRPTSIYVGNFWYIPVYFCGLTNTCVRE
jgi:hypothetical protein